MNLIYVYNSSKLELEIKDDDWFSILKVKTVI